MSPLTGRGAPAGWLARATVLSALTLALALAVSDRVSAPRAGPSDWRQLLEPLARAPLPPDAAVAVVPPDGYALEPRVWVYEASWRRPGHRFALVSEWPEHLPIRLGLGIRLEEIPADWRVVWREGDLVLVEPTR